MKYFLSLNLAWLLFFLVFCTWSLLCCYVLTSYSQIRYHFSRGLVALLCVRLSADKCSWEFYTFKPNVLNYVRDVTRENRENALRVWVYEIIAQKLYKSMKLYLDWIIIMGYFAIHFLCCWLLLSSRCLFVLGTTKYFFKYEHTTEYFHSYFFYGLYGANARKRTSDAIKSIWIKVDRSRGKFKQDYFFLLLFGFSSKNSPESVRNFSLFKARTQQQQRRLMLMFAFFQLIN